MATYAIQYLTQSGSLCGQNILPKDRAVELLKSWRPNPTSFAVVVLIVGSSFQERTTLGDLAMADVFYTRRDALAFVESKL